TARWFEKRRILASTCLRIRAFTDAAILWTTYFGYARFRGLRAGRRQPPSKSQIFQKLLHSDS
ncbi:MAG: hypothetical protein IKX88_14425, partial [Thermoguttaceae bacterium]|nr:hypothetical protein [Thermoguttaceae bacterium]